MIAGWLYYRTGVGVGTGGISNMIGGMVIMIAGLLVGLIIGTISICIPSRSAFLAFVAILLPLLFGFIGIPLLVSQ